MWRFGSQERRISQSVLLLFQFATRRSLDMERSPYQWNDTDMTNAHEMWRSGQSLTAGEIVFNSVREEERPRWAACVLEYALQLSGVSDAELQDVIAMANDRTRWKDGHLKFNAIRKSTIKLDSRLIRTKAVNTRNAIYCLAELVLKVTYNATSPSDEFDEDSGAWVLACLADVLGEIGAGADFEAAWHHVLAIPIRPV
jgi:hypothetical protein